MPAIGGAAEVSIVGVAAGMRGIRDEVGKCWVWGWMTSMYIMQSLSSHGQDFGFTLKREPLL